jgi:hypothetical protein
MDFSTVAGADSLAAPNTQDLNLLENVSKGSFLLSIFIIFRV